mmetsp:Transcript_17221/g.42568  ORF Transcript_17221/g.42568 Transcript_17221/m.42568 type:complete len:427 (+) Transcript_17221:2366-3646(+)
MFLSFKRVTRRARTSSFHVCHAAAILCFSVRCHARTNTIRCAFMRSTTAIQPVYDLASRRRRVLLCARRTLISVSNASRVAPCHALKVSDNARFMIRRTMRLTQSIFARSASSRVSTAACTACTQVMNAPVATRLSMRPAASLSLGMTKSRHVTYLSFQRSHAAAIWRLSILRTACLTNASLAARSSLPLSTPARHSRHVDTTALFIIMAAHLPNLSRKSAASSVISRHRSNPAHSWRFMILPRARLMRIRMAFASPATSHQRSYAAATCRLIIFFSARLMRTRVVFASSVASRHRSRAARPRRCFMRCAMRSMTPRACRASSHASTQRRNDHDRCACSIRVAMCFSRLNFSCSAFHVAKAAATRRCIILAATFLNRRSRSFLSLTFCFWSLSNRARVISSGDSETSTTCGLSRSKVMVSTTSDHA